MDILSVSLLLQILLNVHIVGCGKMYVNIGTNISGLFYHSYWKEKNRNGVIVEVEKIYLLLDTK